MPCRHCQALVPPLLPMPFATQHWPHACRSNGHSYMLQNIKKSRQDPLRPSLTWVYCRGGSWAAMSSTNVSAGTLLPPGGLDLIEAGTCLNVLLSLGGVAFLSPLASSLYNVLPVSFLIRYLGVPGQCWLQPCCRLSIAAKSLAMFPNYPSPLRRNAWHP